MTQTNSDTTEREQQPGTHEGMASDGWRIGCLRGETFP